MTNRVVYAKGFFDLQLEFARTASLLSGLPYPRAVLLYTNLYVRFGLGRQPHEGHPGWQDYVAGLRDAGDPGEWTYRFYLGRAHVDASPPVVASFGCFAYAHHGRDGIRLHFKNAETDGRSPLGMDRRDRRVAELRALFEHAKRTGAPARVAGASWLYNVEAYRRLFPEAYVTTARPLSGRVQRMPLWGQFVDRNGAVREGMARPFLERVRGQGSVDGLQHCFPFQVLGVEAPAGEFYRFYGV